MKETIKSLIVYILISYFVISQIVGFALPTIPLYFWLTLLLLAITLMIVCPLLKFLTIKCKFPTYWLMGSLLMFGVVYLLNLFMTDFSIEVSQFAGLKLGSLEINAFEVTPIISMAVFSVITSFIAGIFREVDKS